MISQIANRSTVTQVEIATVMKTIGPGQLGQVEYQASYWLARLWPDDCQQILYPNTEVMVVGKQGITLLVAPYLHQPIHQTSEFEVQSPTPALMAVMVVWLIAVLMVWLKKSGIEISVIALVENPLTLVENPLLLWENSSTQASLGQSDGDSG